MKNEVQQVMHFILSFGLTLVILHCSHTVDQIEKEADFSNQTNLNKETSSQNSDFSTTNENKDPEQIAVKSQIEYSEGLPKEIMKENVFIVFDLYKDINNCRGYLLYRTHNIIKILDSFKIVIGAAGFPKKKEGDSKTPVGKYHINKIDEISDKASDFDSFGPVKYWLNYPNEYDQKYGYTGSAIEIHGGRENKSAGCIRVLDGELGFGCEKITELKDYLRQGTTVFIIPHIKNGMLGTKSNDAYLIQKVSQFWCSILDKDISYKEINHLMSNLQLDLTQPISIKLNNPIVDEKYNPINCVDGNKSTALAFLWDKLVQKKYSISFNFIGDRKPTKIKIKSGYWKSEQLYEFNSRPKSINIIHPDYSVASELKDKINVQVVYLKSSKVPKKFQLEPSVTTDIRLYIKDIYVGSKYQNDVCISEISFSYD